MLIILSDDQPDEVWWQLMRSAYDWHARVLVDDRSHQFSQPILGERADEVLTKLDLTGYVLQDALSLLKWSSMITRGIEVAKNHILKFRLDYVRR